MSRRAVVLVVALLLAGLAAVAVWRYQETVADSIRADIAEVVVYRATELIEPETPGEEASLVIEESTELAEAISEYTTIFCLGPVSPDAVDVTVCSEHPTDLEGSLTGTFAAGPISAGQLISTDMFVSAADLQLNPLAGDIAAGHMAVAVDPGPIGGVGGMLEPGDRVNVISTFTVRVRTQQEGATVVVGDETVTQTEVQEQPIEVTRTILQNIHVLAVDGRIAGEPPPATETLGTSVVLELLPEQSEALEFARQNSQISLALLPAGEEYTDHEARGITSFDIVDLIDIVQRVRAELENLDG